MSEDERDLDLDSDEEGGGVGFSSHVHGQDKRAHHNALERKRRDHIKDSFTGLKDAIPTLQVGIGVWGGAGVHHWYSTSLICLIYT